MPRTTTELLSRTTSATKGVDQLTSALMKSHMGFMAIWLDNDNLAFNGADTNRAVEAVKRVFNDAGRKVPGARLRISIALEYDVE